MKPPSSEDPRTLWARNLALSRYRPLENDDDDCPEVTLGTPSTEDMREINVRTPEETERLTEENRQQKEKINTSGVGDMILARSLHQMRRLPDEGPSQISSQPSRPPPVEEELSTTPHTLCNSENEDLGASIYSRQPYLRLFGVKLYRVPMEAAMRRVRVSVRTRMDDPKMSDGCDWMKYALNDTKEKTYSGIYYHCAMSTRCPVWKKEQICAQDESILISTYQGEHNHPLPPGAREMFSKIRSAAETLLSGLTPIRDTIARDMAPLPYFQMAYVFSDEFPTITLDMTDPPSSSNNLPQRSPQILQTDLGAMAPEMDGRMIGTFTSDPNLMVATAVAEQSISSSSSSSIPKI